MSTAATTPMQIAPAAAPRNDQLTFCCSRKVPYAASPQIPTWPSDRYRNVLWTRSTPKTRTAKMTRLVASESNRKFATAGSSAMSTQMTAATAHERHTGLVRPDFLGDWAGTLVSMSSVLATSNSEQAGRAKQQHHGHHREHVCARPL